MKNKKLLICNILMVSLLVFVLAFDLITKYVVESKLGLGEGASFLPGFMNLVVVHNDGAAWNLFSGFKILLIIVTFLFLIVYTWFFFSKRPCSYLLSVASGFLLGGCVGNLYDRLVFGYVRDFLNFEFMNFPVFNIADTFLCIGIALLIIYFLFIFTKEQKEDIKINEDKLGDTDDLDKINRKTYSLKEVFNLKQQFKKHKEKKAQKKAEKEDKDK